MSTKTEIVKRWAQDRVGNPYVYGGTGKNCTVSYRQQQANQYPESASLIKKNCQRMSGGKSTCAGCKWYDEAQQKGKQCYDCAQFTRWAMNEIGIVFPSGATSQWKKVDWAKKGTIETLPNQMCIVYKQDNDGTMAHTGIYLGDGTVVDARGTNYGVLHQAQETYGKWSHWAIPRGLEDEEPEVGECNMNGKVVGGNLRLRKEASTASDVICMIPNGSIVGVQDNQGDWMKVEYAGNVGFCMSKYVETNEAKESTSENAYTVTIECSSKEEKEFLLGLLRKAN